MQVLTKLDMTKNQILNVVIHKVDSDPSVSSKDEGMMIYNRIEEKLKYFNGKEWIVIGTGSGGTTFKIDSVINDQSTNDNAAGSKAVVDYVTLAVSEFNGIVSSIKKIQGNSVLKIMSDGTIVGVKIDSEVTESSNNLVTSAAVYSAIKTIAGTVTKADYSCPTITGTDNKCVWEIELEHTTPVVVQVYNNSNEMIFANIKDETNKITITFNGITRISSGTYHAIIIY